LIPILGLFLLVFSGILWLYYLDQNPGLFLYKWSWANDVENQDIPNIMQELAGEWAVEEYNNYRTFGNERDWRKTRLVLNEDGTCEFHNLTLDMTVPFSLENNHRPELTEKTLIGTWVSRPRHIGNANWNRVFAAIWVKVHATEEHIVKQAEESIEKSDWGVFDLYLSGKTERKHEVYADLGVFKVNRTGEYRLYWIPPDLDMPIGSVMKRVK
jgi:hypothetical protein